MVMIKCAWILLLCIVRGEGRAPEISVARLAILNQQT